MINFWEHGGNPGGFWIVMVHAENGVLGWATNILELFAKVWAASKASTHKIEAQYSAWIYGSTAVKYEIRVLIPCKCYFS